MKKIFRYIIVVFLMTISIRKVDALSVDKSEVSLVRGGNISLTLRENFTSKISKIEFNLVYSNKDIKGSFNSSSGIDDNNGIKHSISYSKPISGEVDIGTININVSNDINSFSGKVSLVSAKAITVDGNSIDLDGPIINVKVEEDVSDSASSDKDLLERIDSKLVKINLESGVYEYNVLVNNDIKELDLEPVAKDNKTSINISSQKLISGKDNKITIDVSKGSVLQSYIINVSYEEPLEIDQSKFTANNNYKNKWLILMGVFGILFTGSLITIKVSK